MNPQIKLLIEAKSKKKRDKEALLQRITNLEETVKMLVRIQTGQDEVQPR
jgi:hypothetical protein